jgi:hypothetical protein
VAQDLALFFESEASSAIAACRVMLPLLRVNVALSSSSAAAFAASLISKPEGGDAIDCVVVALLEFEEAAGPWLREMSMQQQHKHQLSKAKKIAVVLEAAAAKLNAARRASVVSGRSSASRSSSTSSEQNDSSVVTSSVYHMCMSRHHPLTSNKSVVMGGILMPSPPPHSLQPLCLPCVCRRCTRVGVSTAE